MVDFGKFGGGAGGPDPMDPLALYLSLDRQQTHVELRAAQVDILQQWRARRGERDFVLKLPTGTGKTTTGLLMLLSYMRETKRPVMYLCPTHQLVAQVVEEGRRCGIPCSIVGPRGSDIAPEVEAGQAVLVATTQKVFNGRSVFQSRYKGFRPIAVLLDDAHAAVETLRQSLSIRASNDTTLYQRLAQLFLPALRIQQPGVAASLEASDPIAVIEVPYWDFLANMETVSRVLVEEASVDGSPAHFPWPLLKEFVRGCRCVLSGGAIEIAPEILPADAIDAFGGAEHRIFMSATLSDEAVLVRDLDCATQGANSPLETSAVGGLGERMVLVPQLMLKPGESVNEDQLRARIADLSKLHRAVVLTPSREAARKWEAVGAQLAIDDQVGPAVDALRDGTLSFAVFANRYDGIDLPDDACRILVLDGLPVSYSLVAELDSRVLRSASGSERTIVHRVEQGMGRAVRSSSDYAAVVLMGTQLVSVISRHEALKEMSEESRLQLELGVQIAGLVKTEGDPIASTTTLIRQCLDRDPAWKSYYAAQVKAKLRANPSSERTKRVELAAAERRAWRDYLGNNAASGSELLQRFAPTMGNEWSRGWLLQKAAWYLHAADAASAMALQRAAHEKNPKLLRPPAGVQTPREARRVASTARSLFDWYRGFEHPNGALAAVESIRARLRYHPDASSEAFEEALRELGDALGFDASRPERDDGRGPDACWMDSTTIVPIEAKNRVALDCEAISKVDAGQLGQAVEWAKDECGNTERLVPAIAHRATMAAEQAFLPDGTRVFTPTSMERLLEALRAAIIRLGSKTADTWEASELEAVVAERGLGLRQLLAQYTEAGR